MVPRRYDHWYEYAGDFLKEAMKGWGLAAVILLGAGGVVAKLVYSHGGDYIKASCAKMTAEAGAADAVAAAVERLAAFAEAQGEFRAEVKADHARAAESDRQTAEILNRIAAILERLEKNDQGGIPPTSSS